MLGSIQSPVIYVSKLMEASIADALLHDLSRDVPWLSVTEARKEAWMNDLDAEYTYGEGRGQRTYKSQPWNESVALLRAPMSDRSRLLANTSVGIPDNAFRWDGCFLNYYANEKNALGWHSD